MSKNQINDFVISRTFNTDPDTMFRMWSEPELMRQWWGPKEVEVKQSEMNFRPGGSYHYCLQAPDGQDIWGKFTYKEIARPELMVWINSFSDAKGGITRHPMSEHWPLELLTTVTFGSEKGQTRVTISWQPHNASETEIKAFNAAHDSMTQGWGGSLDKLTRYINTLLH